MLQSNRSLRPETTTEVEFGGTLDLFASRATIGVTHYRAETHDLILPVDTRDTAVFDNIGRVRNHGWEAVARTRISAGRTALTLAGHWSRNRNRVVGLATDVEAVPFSVSLPGGSTVATLGQPLGVFQGFDFARCGRGLTRIGLEDIQGACADGPAHALYIATDGFPLLDPTQRVLGDPNPEWTGGVDAMLTAGRVTLSAFVEHRHGGVTQNLTRSSLRQHGTHAITELRGQTRIFGRNYFAGPVAGPGAGLEVGLNEDWFVGQTGIAGARSQFMEDATHTRLREVSASIRLPSHWTSVIGLNEVELTLSGRNLKVWSDYSGFDPETTLGGAAAANRGIDWFVTPLMRGWIVSAELKR